MDLQKCNSLVNYIPLQFFRASHINTRKHFKRYPWLTSPKWLSNNLASFDLLNIARFILERIPLKWIKQKVCPSLVSIQLEGYFHRTILLSRNDCVRKVLFPPSCSLRLMPFWAWVFEMLIHWLNNCSAAL